MRKPLVKAVLFSLGGCSYAWIGSNMKPGDWESEPIQTAAAFESRKWYEAAFAASIRAYRRLQKKHPDKDIVCSADKAPVGHSVWLGYRSPAAAVRIPPPRGR